MTAVAMPKAWRKHRYHATQVALERALMSRDPSDRNTVTPCGRRSGKTATHLRGSIRQQLSLAYQMGVQDYTQVIGLPTFAQAIKVAWRPLKALAPRDAVRRIRESELTIEWVHGGLTIVGGMDKAERFEGFPIDDLYLDEFADMKPNIREDHLQPSLSTPGRPPGREHIYGTPSTLR